MDRIGVIMEELGFNPEADDSVKAAFVKNLIRQAYGVDVEIPKRYQKQEELTPETVLEQLEFDFKDEVQK